ncbi:MAG: zinc ABC transporter ATP-binding protein AztA [Caldilineaceae bacterium]
MQSFWRALEKSSPHDQRLPSIQLQQVTVRYGTVIALEQVTFALAKGDQVAVVGPNGAGKSTLFNLIAGILKPTQGTVSIYGSGPQRHTCVGYVPQRNQIDWRFPVTVADVVMMGRVGKIGLLRWARRQDREIVKAALARVGMAELAKRQIGALSGGQQQRVFLARTLAQEAELLLLDEPLTGLDLPSQEIILSLLAELHAEGVTMLVATHDLSQAAEYFPKVMLLNRQMVALGAPAEVLTQSFLAEAYGSQLQILPNAQGALVLTDTCCGGGEPVASPVNGVHTAVVHPVSPTANELKRLS